jgi:hypothetical protein
MNFIIIIFYRWAFFYEIPEDDLPPQILEAVYNLDVEK